MDIDKITFRKFYVKEIEYLKEDFTDDEWRDLVFLVKTADKDRIVELVEHYKPEEDRDLVDVEVELG